MMSLRDALKQYLGLRRGLGVELAAAGGRLQRFVEFLERERAPFITRDLALRWAVASPGSLASTHGQRLGDVRGFAAWLSTLDPRTEVPSPKLLPYRILRKPPYIYSDDEIESLVRAAAGLPSFRGLRGLACSTLFGLLAATGLRLSEALALDDSDVDLAAGILHIRRAKFGKERFVPVHESTRKALMRFVRRRDEILPRRPTDAFFVLDRGTRFGMCAARYNFAKVSREVGLRRPAGGHRHGRGPRLHDMRHRFAAKRMVEWYREGLDVEREIHKLSTYLGHVHVADTYWYIEAVPELLQLATKRLMRAQRKASS